jgi:hypothetical protein
MRFVFLEVGTELSYYAAEILLVFATESNQRFSFRIRCVFCRFGWLEGAKNNLKYIFLPSESSYWRKILYHAQSVPKVSP